MLAGSGDSGPAGFQVLWEARAKRAQVIYSNTRIPSGCHQYSCHALMHISAAHLYQNQCGCRGATKNGCWERIIVTQGLAVSKWG